MQRYAVLLDLHDPNLRPFALVTEHDDAVLVHFAVECGLKSVYREPYEVMEPDGTTIRYAPGETGYFTSVLNTLSRGFVVSELGSQALLDVPAITELYGQRVILPRTRQRVRYAPAEPVYVYSTEEPTVEAGGAVVSAASDSLLCAAA